MFNFSRESRRKKKEYSGKLKELREEFRKAILATPLTAGIDKEYQAANVWSPAILIEEAETLRRLTRWLIVLSTVLSILTFVLAYPIISKLWS